MHKILSKKRTRENNLCSFFITKRGGTLYERCMKYKCKTCPELYNCDLIEKLQSNVLTYRPFEDIIQILENKRKERKQNEKD